MKLAKNDINWPSTLFRNSVPTPLEDLPSNAAVSSAVNRAAPSVDKTALRFVAYQTLRLHQVAPKVFTRNTPFAYVHMYCTFN